MTSVFSVYSGMFSLCQEMAGGYDVRDRPLTIRTAVSIDCARQHPAIGLRQRLLGESNLLQDPVVTATRKVP
jgi:hypothetical protein